MGYDDEMERFGQKRSRARQPVKRMGDRDIDRQRNREPGYSEPGLNLITDTFKDDERRSRRETVREEERSKSKSRSRKNMPSNREKQERSGGNGSGRKDSGIYNPPARKKARKKKRKILIIIFEVIILLSVLAFAGYSYLQSKMSLMKRLPWDPEEIRNVNIPEEKQEQMKGYWTIAVFGVDSRNSTVGKGNNSDVNIICNINQDTGEIKLVSVFRDSYLNINDKNSYNKINAAYLQGGPEQAVKALNKNLDLDIDDYVTFNWKAVADAINILGGIDVELSKAEFYYINAFITETVKATGVASTQLKKAGMNHLDGVQAVAYGRLRLMDTDYARTERQRKVISLAFEKAKKADWATLNNIIQTVFPQVATSVELNDILGAGRNIMKYHMSESTGFPAARGEVNMGSKGACVIPQTLENNVIDLHKFLFGDENYTPTETVRSISKKIISDTGLAKNKKPAGDVGTGGGSVPKTTKAEKSAADIESKERGSSAHESSGAYYETDESGGILFPTRESRPGRTQESETDSRGNIVFPTRERETGPASSTEHESSSESGIPRPGGGTIGSTESAQGNNDRPGGGTSGNGSNGGAVPGGGTAPGGNVPGGGSNGATVPGGGSSGSGNSGPNQAPGYNTDTGVIIEPGNGGRGSGNSNQTPGTAGGNIEYSGPMGNN